VISHYITVQTRPSLMTKVLPAPFKKFFENLKKHITSLTYLLACSAAFVPVTTHEFTTLRNCWTFGTAFNRLILAQSMESAYSRLRTGQRRSFWALTIIFYSTKTGSTQKNTKKTNLNKLNQRATCLQISQHGGRVEHCR